MEEKPRVSRQLILNARALRWSPRDPSYKKLHGQQGIMRHELLAGQTSPERGRETADPSVAVLQRRKQRFLPAATS